jgi:hypothetical protein
MEIADGGGYAGTRWEDYGMEAMYQLVAPLDTAAHDTVEDGWSRTCALTDQHLTTVRRYRQDLATAWPPKRNRAAAAYIERLDALIQHVQETHDAAVANYTAFKTVNAAIKAARPVLTSAHEDYMRNESALANWRAEYANAQEAREVATRNGVRQTAPTVLPVAPVPESVQEGLLATARTEMYRVSSAAIESQFSLKEPRPYRPDRDDLDRTDPKTRAAGGGTAAPLVPVPAGPPPTSAPPPSPEVRPAAGGLDPSGGSGPVLTGSPPIPGRTPIPPSSSPPLPPVAPPVTGGPVVLVPPGPGIAPEAPQRFPVGGPGPRPSAGRPGSPVSAIAPNGVIGEMPAGPSHVRGATSGMSRVNPVGGVIGSAPIASPSRAARATPGATHAQLVGQPGGARRSDAGRNADRHWDPDNPWEVDEGVDPVLMPSPEPGPIDPGPAIGYNR